MGGKLSAVNGAEKTDGHFILTIVSDNIERLLDKADHEARLVGQVKIDAISDLPMSVEDGYFNLFTQSKNNQLMKHMVYRMRLITQDGRRYYFKGHKRIMDDKGFDLWKDTTTLFVDVYDGDSADGPLIYVGEFTIAPKDFVTQLATMKITNAKNAVDKAAKLAKFSKFFAAQLLDTYLR